MNIAVSRLLLFGLKTGVFADQRSLLFFPQTRHLLRKIRVCVPHIWCLRNTCTNIMPRGRGSFIVFEGLDRSGKSTQFHLLSEALRIQNIPVECMRFPDRSGTNPTSVELCQHLAGFGSQDPETTHRLFTKQRKCCRNQMAELLEQGITLVVDRYSHSGVAYSAAKGLSMEWCKKQESGLLQPDLVVFLDILPEEAQKRGEYGHERYERLDFQQKVYKAYGELRDEKWKVISATLPMDEIASQCLEAALGTISSNRAEPLGQLWPPTIRMKMNVPPVRKPSIGNIFPRRTILRKA